MAMTLLALPQAPVWVLDDPSGPCAGQALAVAGRLGLPFLRMPPDAPWRTKPDGAGGSSGRGRSLEGAPGGARDGTPDRAAERAADGAGAGADGIGADAPERAWALGDREDGPQLVLSSGFRNGARAVTLKARHGSVLVHFTRRASAALPFDRMVTTSERRIASHGRVIAGLGPLHVVSPALLVQARSRWRERLSHLPRPRIMLLARLDGTGGRTLAGGAAAHVASLLAGNAAERRGSILASVSPSIGRDALSAVSARLQPSLHLMYRTDEPGEDATLGFLASADAVVVMGGTAQALSEAASADAPVFGALLEAGDAASRRMARTLMEEGRLRPYAGGLSPWPRLRLDEAGRVAGELRAMLGL